MAANTDSPFGLRPIRHLNGNPWNGATMRCYIPSTYATALYIGDPVVFTGEANTAGTAMVVQKATAGDGNKISGVITSFEVLKSDLTKQYHPASTNQYCNVCIDPDVIYEIQACSGAILAAGTCGLNAVLIYTHAGSTLTGLSGVEMDSGAAAAPAANGSYQLYVLRAVDRADNDISTVNAKWEVLINLHSLRAVDASAGGAAEGALGG